MIQALSLLITDAVPTVTFGSFQIEKTVKLADFLTPVSLLVTVCGFVWSIYKDRKSREAADADRIRAAASKALGKLQRWKEVALWYYRDVQPVFVDVSGELAADFDPGKARDHLWMALSAARIKNAERLLNESLETAYVELASYYPGVYDPFRAAIRAMKTIDEERYSDALDLGQRAVMSFEGRRNGYVPPLLGNQLRSVTGAVSTLLAEQLNDASRHVESFLVSLINESDQLLLDGKRSTRQIANPPERYPSVLDAFEERATAHAG